PRAAVRLLLRRRLRRPRRQRRWRRLHPRQAVDARLGAALRSGPARGPGRGRQRRRRAFRGRAGTGARPRPRPGRHPPGPRRQAHVRVPLRHPRLPLPHDASAGTVTDPRVAPQAARFGDVADRYERARPLYPESALSELAARCRVGRGTAVVDLGAGAGKPPPHLAAVGAPAAPAAGMRGGLEVELPGVPVLDGTAEDIPLPDASVGAVTAGQAFHWFDPPPALDEIARGLRPAGGGALARNE